MAPLGCVGSVVLGADAAYSFVDGDPADLRPRNGAPQSGMLE